MMMMQKNRIEVAGFLADKPARRFLPSGMPVSNVRLGETYAYKGGQGNTQRHANWHNLSFYGDLADVALTYDKGDNLFVEGSIEQRKFTPAKDGVQRTVHEVIVRSCHLVAPPQGVAGKSVEPDAATAVQVENGGGEHEPWPVG
jgi:single-strand DNA-binding protein